MIEIKTWHNQSIITITDEEMPYVRFSGGIKKVKLIVKYHDELLKFLKEHSLPTEKKPNSDGE